jgi:hypothetical protein
MAAVALELSLIFGYGTGGYLFYMNSAGNLIFAQLGNNNILTGPAITDTNFHHVAVTINGGTVVFYLDGVAYPVGGPTMSPSHLQVGLASGIGRTMETTVFWGHWMN